MDKKKKRKIIILDLKEVLKENKEFWKDMNTTRLQISLKNAIKFLEEE